MVSTIAIFALYLIILIVEKVFVKKKLLTSPKIFAICALIVFPISLLTGGNPVMLFIFFISSLFILLYYASIVNLVWGDESFNKFGAVLITLGFPTLIASFTKAKGQISDETFGAILLAGMIGFTLFTVGLLFYLIHKNPEHYGSIAKRKEPVEDANIIVQTSTTRVNIPIETEIETQYLNLISHLYEYPESSSTDLRELFPLMSRDEVKVAAIEVFKQFLNENNFHKASLLLSYHPVDEHDLLSVTRALDTNNRTGEVVLLEKFYKIILERDETAYQKLPCNWQNIHTYLAPLEDGIDQSDILDTGNIYITDLRVFFVGKKGSETVLLEDISHMDLKEDALQFFRDEGLSEIFAFPTAHHAAYANLIIRHLLESTG